MDIASGVAGLMGLAALTTQSTLKVVRVIRDIRQIAQTLQSHLRWLRSLTQLLDEIGNTVQEFANSEVVIDTQLLQSYLDDCLQEVQALSLRVEPQITSVTNTEGFKRNFSKIKAVLASNDVKTHQDAIQRLMNNLSLCHSSIMR